MVGFLLGYDYSTIFGEINGKLGVSRCCHCEPVTDVTGVAIRSPEPFRLLGTVWDADCHASGAPRSESIMEMIAGGNHTMIPVRTGSQ